MAKPLRTLPGWVRGFAYHGPDGTSGEAEAIWAPPGIDTLHSCMCLCVFCVYVTASMHACAASHAKARRQSQVSPCLTVMYVTLADPQASKVSPLSASHFSIETLGLQMLPLAVRLLHTCGIWTQVLVLFNSKCSHPLSHLPSPLRSSSTAMNPPFKGLPLIWPLHLAPRTLASRNRFSLFTVIQFLANLTCLQNAVSTEYCSMYTAPSKFLEQRARGKTSHWTHV